MYNKLNEQIKKVTTFILSNSKHKQNKYYSISDVRSIQIPL